MQPKWTRASSLASMASVRRSEKHRSRTGIASSCRSAIPGQTGLVICQRRFNYGAVKTGLSSKMPCYHPSLPKIVPGDRGGDEACTSVVLELMIQLETPGCRQAAGTRHITQLKQEDLDSAHKAAVFHTFVVQLSAVLQLKCCMLFFLELL